MPFNLCPSLAELIRLQYSKKEGRAAPKRVRVTRPLYASRDLTKRDLEIKPN